MASFHKDPRGRSPFFYAAFLLPNGKRAFRSTRQRDRRKAQDVARAWEKASDAARQGVLMEAQARKVLDGILESVGEAPIRVATTREFFSHWLERKRLAKKAATGERYSTKVARFLAAVGPRADQPLTSLSPADVTRFREARMKDRVALTTVRMDLKIVRGILSSARRQGLILHNAGEAVELPLATMRGRDVFTADEVRRLHDAASPEWRTAILLAFYTGQRLSDVTRLRWDRVDFDRGTIAFVQGKTGTAVEVPIHPELQAHLFAIAEDQPEGCLCPTLASAKASGRSGLSLQFAAVMARAGIGQRQVQTRDHRPFSQLSFHSLRQSFATALAQAGVAPDLRMALTGHKTLAAHGRYTHDQLEPLKRAIAVLPRLHAEGNGQEEDAPRPFGSASPKATLTEGCVVPPTGVPSPWRCRTPASAR